MTSSKDLLFWIIGGICLFLGVLIVSSVDISALGVTTLSATIAYVIGFILILVAGMFWVSIGR